MLMMEAASVLSNLDQQVLDDLQVRYHLVDELEGSALMLDDYLQELKDAIDNSTQR